MVAGHLVESGPQSVGGAVAGLDEVELALPHPFPAAEVAQDGSCVVTKESGSGGPASVDTVEAQLLHEIQRPIDP